MAEVPDLDTALGGVAKQGELDHLQRLLGYWGMLADLCFSDLLLCVPSGDDAVGRGFMVIGQVRPSTTQTILVDDRIGSFLDEHEEAMVRTSWETGQVIDGEISSDQWSEPKRLQCIPVRRNAKVVGIIVRYAAMAVGRRPGELERTYVELFERFVAMITSGRFPFPSQDWAVEDAPRVGDGVLVLDRGARIAFASPNAVTALHRLGVVANAVGSRLGELGLGERAVSDAFGGGLPTVDELSSPSGTVVLARVLPLIALSEPDGALVLLRDVSDLRRRDRMLLSKDATIREIHHRVKNNLQTISSLLRLQARRLGEGEGRLALGEAERRIQSMAVVHDLLARDAGDQVSFDAIVAALVRMARESVLPPMRITFEVKGDAGALPAGVATPMAVLLSELLQNAVEHAFVGTPGGTITVEVSKGGETLRVRVADDGRGLAPGSESGSTLGLTIVRDLVEGQLGGRLELSSTPGGLTASVAVPAPDQEGDLAG